MRRQPTPQANRPAPEVAALTSAALERLRRADPERHAHSLAVARLTRPFQTSFSRAYARHGVSIDVVATAEPSNDPPTPGAPRRLWSVVEVRSVTPPESINGSGGLSDEERAHLAGVLHDVRRNDDGRPQLFVPDEVESRHPASLLHGPLAAQWAWDQGLRDVRVLFAVRYHTIGHPRPTPLLCALMLADALEPRRDFPGVDKLRAVAEASPLEALLSRLEQTTGHVRRRGGEVHPNALEQMRFLAALIESGSTIDPSP